MTTMVTGETIRNWRESRGVRAAFVAERAGLTKQQLSNIENGKRAVEVNEFVAIADALGMKAGDLLPNSGGVPLQLKELVDLASGFNESELRHAMTALRTLVAFAEERSTQRGNAQAQLNTRSTTAIPRPSGDVPFDARGSHSSPRPTPNATNGEKQNNDQRGERRGGHGKSTS